jgi:hypothetical protein
MLKDTTPRSKNLIQEIGDERDILLLKKVGPEKNSKVRAGKLEDPSTSTVKICFEEGLMDAFVCVQVNKNLLAAIHWRGNA